MYEIISPSLVANASNSFRYARPDMYLGALSHNASAYRRAVLGDQGLVKVTYLDPTETVPVMVRNLVGPNTTKAMRHKLAN